MALVAAAAAAAPRGAHAAAVAGRRLVDEAAAPLARPTGPPPGAAGVARASISVDLGGWSKPVADGFLGISHEWVDVDELIDPAALQLLKDLAAYGTGPLSLRIGGGSTDLQRDVPGPAAWGALRRLHAELGAALILGINFEAGDASLTRRQYDALRRELPAAAVAAVELGNEPNFYAGKLGRSSADYLACCYVNDWNAAVVPLACPRGDASCWNAQFAGPAWGHVFLSPETLEWWLRCVAFARVGFLVRACERGEHGMGA